MAAPLIYAAIAGLKLLQGVQQANSIQRQAELQKELDKFNIEQAELDAFRAEQQGYTEQARYQSAIDANLAAGRTAYIAADVDPNFGTARDVQSQNRVAADLNLLDIQAQAHQKAMGIKQQVNNSKTQSTLNFNAAETKAVATRNAAIIGGAGDALTGYENYGKTGKAIDKGSIAFEAPLKGGADNFNYNAYYGWAPQEKA